MLRVARWAAVSTAEQAKADKVSIRVQLDKAAEIILNSGWVETCKPFVVSGESRTKWTSLYHAEKHIPELREMLEAASRREFDLLIVYDLNRFRDLMRPVFDALSDYEVQLYVIAHPREPVEPHQYSEEHKNAMGMIVDMYGMISHNEINSLRKHYRDKMPRRITDKGLHAGTGKPPYGYRKPPGQEFNHEAVLIPDPPAAQVVLQIKDWCLAGKSNIEIARLLNKNKTPSPTGTEWRHGTVAYILHNPFYAGMVTFGKRKNQRDRRNGSVKRIRQSAPAVAAKGRHAALWDQSTHRRIQSEMARRGPAHGGWRARQLSRLLYCSVCGSPMWAGQTPFYRAKEDFRWRCSSGLPGHVQFNNSQILPIFIERLIAALSSLDKLSLPEPQDPRPMLTVSLKDLRQRKARWMDAFESGLLDAADYAARVASLNDQIAATQSNLNRLTEETLRSQERRNELSELARALDSLPKFILDGDKSQVNSHLRAVLEKVIVNKSGEMEFIWR